MKSSRKRLVQKPHVYAESINHITSSHVKDSRSEMPFKNDCCIQNDNWSGFASISHFKRMCLGVNKPTTHTTAHHKSKKERNQMFYTTLPLKFDLSICLVPTGYGPNLQTQIYITRCWYLVNKTST